MMNLALYAISAALLAGGPSDPPRDDASTQSSATAAPSQAPADEAQPPVTTGDDSSDVTHGRSAVQPRRAPLRGDMPAEEGRAAKTSKDVDPASAPDPGLNDGYFAQQEIWTAP